MNTTQTTTQTQNATKYWDLKSAGYGFIQRVREVKAKAGRRGAKPALACTVAALVGPASNPTYRYFDCIVSGPKAKELVQQRLGVDDTDPKQRPFVKFLIGDLWLDPYISKKGANEGKPAASMKARLITAELVDRAERDEIEEYELITRGIGYLYRPKVVTPQNGDPFVACTVAALVGQIPDGTDDAPETPEFRYFDCTVRDEAPAHLVRRCMKAAEEKRKIQITFRFNDVLADAYLRTKGDHAGEPGASLKSTLVFIGQIKVDGELVYKAPKPESQEPADDAGDDLPASEKPVQTAQAEPEQEAIAA